MDKLFKDSNGKIYGPEEVCLALKDIGVQDCEILFIHSDIMFGSLVEGFKRQSYLNILWEVFESLKIHNLIVPTFTYSFCNHEDYDVRKSRTSMGALNEYIRKKEGRYRTLDPLLSLSVPVGLKEYFQLSSPHSLGADSGFDIIHRLDGVKFLFFGASLGKCFTYVHYVEKMLDVPYRFDMPFSGKIIDEKGQQFERIQYMHTACYGVKAAEYDYFEDYLEIKGLLKKRRLGDKFVSCLSEKDAYKEIGNKIQKNIHYFLEVPFQEKDLEHKYTKGLNGERITHC